MPKLVRIRIHPFKSLDAQDVAAARLLAGGALEHDRRFALTDAAGDFVNGKRTAAIHLLRSRFDPATDRLAVRIEGASQEHVFHVAHERSELEAWFSRYFEFSINVVENAAGGMPDDLESPGPTVVSTATLTVVADWFGLGVDEVRDRFRANLEIDAAEPFWEDRLAAEGFGSVWFRLGEAGLAGTNPCQRCIVPTRNPYTGESIGRFAKTFAEKRRESLPVWAPAGRFDHFYRLAVNTRPVGSRECTLRVGDELTVLEN